MDNCDLEKLSVSDGELHLLTRSHRLPVTVGSNVNKVTLGLSTSDCGTSYSILSGYRPSTVKLKDGLNRVEIEVVAEDGTLKKYRVEISKLSPKLAELTNLALQTQSLCIHRMCHRDGSVRSRVSLSGLSTQTHQGAGSKGSNRDWLV
uniref:Cadherin-like beta-sandwich-like domain-containing protein n=2 Tax=Nothobranchius furzeri TaxID=105023 RepID=A0A1A8A6F9_NOTFU